MLFFFLCSDLDSVSFCVLAFDEEFESDIALQIHFTLIQAFCFDNDISIVRVNDMQRLAEIVDDKSGQLDAHCVLITVCTSLTKSAFSDIYEKKYYGMYRGVVANVSMFYLLNRTLLKVRGRIQPLRSCTCSAKKAAE